MKLKTIKEVNDFLAEKTMGWTHHSNSPMAMSIWKGKDNIGMPVSMWRPDADLNQAFSSLWKWQQSGLSTNEFTVNNEFVGMYLCGKRVTEEPVGPSAAGTARAICIALCWAHGAEVELG